MRSCSLYGFFVIEHGRRHIVHFNATFHPTSAWVIQQLREAFPYDTAPRYLIFAEELQADEIRTFAGNKKTPRPVPKLGPFEIAHKSAT